MVGLPARSNPIRRPEEDLLGRAGFAKAVANLVRSPMNDGLVVLGIEGPWGAGKSSVLSMASSELARDRRNRILVVSAWRTAGQDQFLASLSYSLTMALRRDWQGAPLRIAFARLMRQPASMVMAICLPILTFAALATLPDVRSWVQEIVERDPKQLAASLGLFGLPALAFIFTKLSQPVLEGIRSLLGTARIDTVGASERFAFDFDVLSAAQRKGSRFIVLVEDLDRCSPEHLVGVLGAIAQMWSHPKADKIAFLLAYDRAIVLKGIEQGAAKHLLNDGSGQIGGRTEDQAAEYLDRVVHLELPLPEPIPARDAERSIRWPVVPAAVRGAAYSLFLVAIGLIFLASETVTIGAGALAAAVLLFLAIDCMGAWACRPSSADAMPEDWDVAAKAVAQWIDEQPLRVQTKIKNRAGAALSLRKPADLTSWEALSIAALATRWPDAFAVGTLRGSRGRGAMDIDTAFGEADVTVAIRQMQDAGMPTAHFQDAAKLHDVVSAFRR